MKLTHLNEHQQPTMVDVGAKSTTSRTAIASGKIYMSAQAYEAFKNSTGKKGPVSQTAIVAGIMGAKKTSELIPMCHNILIDSVNIEIFTDDDTHSVRLESTLKCNGKTGIEMEALTSVSVGLLTIYDMLKAIDKTMRIEEIFLKYKSGGKSGEVSQQH
ncbi:molybdenum cofactor biosynthesis protein C [Helicobacter enhydrae]|uniref:Cyclic pyranopterin monophosphate synthase n=1 Tax=Helicobacter enhydrae TaxID=222136 RepID=A0A1B1U452_9HELI|nr:cyclic pyranopterin monophosphate synthase MoaC [Helicobacter enhydrae]ANV97564.1 molybdenum cofactor biosynthesis protein C [Helicobacter enhydrae]